MIQIKYLKEVRGHKAGDVVNISKGGADSAVAAGVAEYVDLDKAPPTPQQDPITIPERIKGFNFVPLPNNPKAPKGKEAKGWTTKIVRYDDPAFIEYLKTGKNYGVQSNNSTVIIDGVPRYLIIVDYDKKDAMDIAISKFPETFTTSSNSPKKTCHQWFASDNNEGFKTFDETGDTLIDVLGAGNQVVGPGSKHPSGSIYSVIKDVPIAFVPYAQLEAIIRPLDKTPKKEKKIKIPIVKSINNDAGNEAVNKSSMKDVLHSLGVDTSKNPTNCPMNHPSKRGECFSWNDETCHCFHCDGGWNKYSLIREIKGLSDKETFEWFAEKAGMLNQLKKARKEFVEQKEKVARVASGKIEIQLPYQGNLISNFAQELADILKDKNTLFYRPDLREVVEILELKYNEKITFQGFRIVRPSRFVTLAERYIDPYIFNNKKERISKSMPSELASVLLQSSQIQDALPRIDKIFTVPIPIMYKGILTFPQTGYDPRFNSWLSNDSPKISNPKMSLDEAKQIIKTIYQEFCFKDDQDFINAVAALLTPFLRGLFKEFNTRTPVNFYKANRERSGKDYCAGITGIVYEGKALEDSPVSNSENSRSNNTDELRKKILAAFIAGRKRLHFSNNKGFIDNAVLEAIATAEKYSDRVLGRNEVLSFDNDLDISLSGNLGVTFTPDLANRCRFINLFLDIEDANARQFNNPNLHNWIKENRSLILSALFALVRNWIEKGKPVGKVNFASFPEWAEVCGGIMEAAGYKSPCTANEEISIIGGDSETQDMKVLFELCYAKHPNEWINRNHMIQVMNDEEIFSYLDFSNRSDQTKFGKLLSRWVGRILSDIKLVIESANARGSRQQYKFEKYGKVGKVGNIHSSCKLDGNPPRLECNVKVAKVAKVAKEGASA